MGTSNEVPFERFDGRNNAGYRDRQPFNKKKKRLNQMQLLRSKSHAKLKKIRASIDEMMTTTNNDNNQDEVLLDSIAGFDATNSLVDNLNADDNNHVGDVDERFMNVAASSMSQQDVDYRVGMVGGTVSEPVAPVAAPVAAPAAVTSNSKESSSKPPPLETKSSSMTPSSLSASRSYRKSPTRENTRRRPSGSPRRPARVRAFFFNINHLNKID